jgi:hypothetical protein
MGCGALVVFALALAALVPSADPADVPPADPRDRDGVGAPRRARRAPVASIPPTTDPAPRQRPVPEEVPQVEPDPPGVVGPITVVGRVIDSDGRPILDARVAGSPCLPSRGLRPHADGRFQFTFRSPECRLVASRADGALVAWTDDVWVTGEPGDIVDVLLVFPSFRTGGLGVSIGPHERGIEILAVHPGTPAARLGLQSGDVMLEVDGTDAAALDLEEFTRTMTGPVGTEVDFVVAEGGGDVESSYTIVRAALREDDDGGVYGVPVDVDTGADRHATVDTGGEALQDTAVSLDTATVDPY